jgi:hypothetical protein
MSLRTPAGGREGSPPRSGRGVRGGAREVGGTHVRSRGGAAAERAVAGGGV